MAVFTSAYKIDSSQRFHEIGPNSVDNIIYSSEKRTIAPKAFDPKLLCGDSYSFLLKYFPKMLYILQITELKVYIFKLWQFGDLMEILFMPKMSIEYMFIWYFGKIV